MIKNKKGGINFDMFIGILIIFFAIFTTFISYTIWINWNSQVQALDVGDATVKAQINEMGQWFFLIDKAIPFIFIALWAIVIMSSLTVKPEHPFFFLISLIVLGLLTITSFIIVDFGTTLFEHPFLQDAQQALTMSVFFTNNLHWISFLVMFASTVWFYSKDNFGLNVGRGIE